MIGFFLIISLIGIGLIVYGVWEMKNVYSDQHYEDVKVVALQPYRTTNLMLNLASAAGGFVYPVVELDLGTGVSRRVRLHSYVSKAVFSQYPELNIGGRIRVTYFGQKPKKAFLTDHPMAQTPMKSSAALLVGIAMAVLGIGMLAYTIYCYYFT